MPEGDDKLGGHFWWSDAPSICVSMVSEMILDLWYVDRPNLTSTTTLPLMGRATLISLVGASKEPHY